MDCDGTILSVNDSFKNNFGYSNQEIKGLNFNVLFNETDKEKKCPETELETVLANGNPTDENYVVHKNGTEIWATGEALLVKGTNGLNYIVKDIVNLQSKKHLQFFVNETENLLERLFESSNEISVIVLDGGLRILKVNNAFLHLFEIETAPAAGSTLSSLNHTFWNDPSIKQDLRNIVVKNQSLQDKKVLLEAGKTKRTIRLNSKLVDKEGGEKKLFIIIQ
jgi:PAS domain S-box-containing protein